MKGSKSRTLFKSISFRLVAGVVAIILPFCIYYIYNSVYSINAIRNQAANSNKKMISLYMKMLDNQLDNVGKYMADNIINDSDFLDLQYQTDENQSKLAKTRVFNKLSNDQPQYNFVDSIFVFTTNKQDYLAVYNSGVDFAVRNEMGKYLRGLISSRHNLFSSSEYKFTAKVGDTFYFFHILKNADMYIGLWVSFDNLEMPLELMNIGEKGTSFFVDASNEIMNHREFISGNGIVLKNDYSNYYMARGKNNYLVVGQKSDGGFFTLVALIPDRQILGNLTYLNYIVAIMSIFTLLMILIFIEFLRRTVLHPFKRITAVMKQVQGGDMDARIKPFAASNEVSMITGTFNRMMDQIKDLKISVYEEQLGKQKEELEHLQLQIRPHFILNSLNIIHSLAQIKDYKLIQEMSLCLSEYFSYISRKKVVLVRLEEELQHIKNYLRIQELRFTDYFTYDIQVPSQYCEVPVPPLVIQTFVENTIKYALNMDDRIHLLIVITPVELDCGEGIRITMTNTGECMDEEILELIRAGKRIVDENGEHIGIWNVQRRLELIYLGKAKMKLENMQPKGVFIEIELPVKP